MNFKQYVAGMLIVTAAGVCCAQEEFSPSQHPVKAVADKYAKSAAEIDALAAEVLAADRSAADRLKSFRLLRRKFPEATLSVAAKAVTSDDEQLAKYAVELLCGAAAMSDHKMPTGAGHQHDHVMHYMMQKHELAKSGLRKAAQDGRKPIYERAATTLASLGDAAGLAAITEAGKKGVYGEDTVVGVLGLAPQDVAGQYIEPYLKSESKTVQVAAVGQLARIPKYQTQVKNDYLLNADADPRLRIAAIQAMGTDAGNVLPLLLDPMTQPSIYSKAATIYIDSNLARLTKGEAMSLSRAIKSYAANNDGFDAELVLEPLKDKFDLRL